MQQLVDGPEAVDQGTSNAWLMVGCLPQLNQMCMDAWPLDIPSGNIATVQLGSAVMRICKQGSSIATDWLG